MEQFINWQIAAATVPAVAFVLQILPSGFCLSKHCKMLLSVVVGIGVAVATLVSDPSSFDTVQNCIMVGAISGAAATGAFGAAGELAKKTRASK